MALPEPGSAAEDTAPRLAQGGVGPMPPASAPAGAAYPGTYGGPRYPGYPPGVGYPGTAYLPPGYPGTYAPFPGYGYTFTPPPPKPRGDTYRLVVSIISIVSVGLLLVGGGLLTLFLLLASVINSSVISENLGFWSLILLATVLALAGGGFGLFQSIRAVMGRASAPLRLPRFLLPLGLTVVVFVAAILFYDFDVPRGSAIIQTPLLLLSGILPALTVFSLAAQRLGYPTTWRRVWLSFIGGIFLSALVAGILELVASGILTSILQVGTPTPGVIQNTDVNTLIYTFLVYSVVAPLAEEGLKPAAPLVLIGRLRGPAEAFIVGMSAGIGFAILETTGYIGQGQGDWVLVAFSRLGAGLLHGLGAGMTTMGWYYIFRGKGVSRRFLKGFGAIAYAIFQHGAWNGLSVVLSVVSGPVADFLNTPVWLFGLPATVSDYLLLVINALLVLMLLTVTGRLAKGAPPAAAAVPKTILQPEAPAPLMPVTQGGLS